MSLAAVEDHSKKWSYMNWRYLVVATKEYCVCVDQEIDVDWATTPDHEARGAADPRQYHEIMDQVSDLETAPCDNLSENVRLHYKRLIGEAIARNFDNQYDSARRMLGIAAAYFRARNEETSRKWYLIASYKAAGPAFLLGIIFWLGRNYVIPILGVRAFHIILAAVAGAMGALLSVIIRSGALRFDCSAGRSLHDLEGASRICAGMLSGALIALAVESGLVLEPLLASANRVTILLVAAFAAGTTERFAPSIISKLAPDGPGNARAENNADTKDAP